MVILRTALLSCIMFFFYSLSFSENTEWRTYLSGISIRDFAEEGQFIWAGTSNGLFRVAKATGDTIRYTTDNSGLPDNWINTITVDKNGIKWIGTTKKGLTRFDGSAWMTYTDENSGFRGSAYAIAEDGTGNLWIATGQVWPSDGNGLVNFNGTSWQTYKDDTITGISLKNTLVIDGNGTKWIGTGSQGLVTFDGSAWTIYTTTNSGLPHNTVWSIAIDKSGARWIATNGGLVTFDGTNWTLYNQTNSPLPSDYVYAVAIDNNDVKWIGTGDGFAKFDGTNWDVYTNANSGLPSEGVEKIIIDSDGNKWLGTSGLSVFNETGIVTAVESDPSPFTLSQNYPNPFNPSTTIAYFIPEPGTVSLTIHNSLGQQVRTLVNGMVPAGRHEAVWDGCDEMGNPSANGLYFSRLQAGEMVRTNKMLLMK